MNLKKLIAGTLVSAAVFAATADESPRYVFYFIGDGMGLGHVNAAQAYNRMVRGIGRYNLLGILACNGLRGCRNGSCHRPQDCQRNARHDARYCCRAVGCRRSVP